MSIYTSHPFYTTTLNGVVISNNRRLRHAHSFLAAQLNEADRELLHSFSQVTRIMKKKNSYSYKSLSSSLFVISVSFLKP